MRCRACDAIMTSDEMVMREETGEMEDLCTTCRKRALDDSEYESTDAEEIREVIRWLTRR